MKVSDLQIWLNKKRVNPQLKVDGKGVSMVFTTHLNHK